MKSKCKGCLGLGVGGICLNGADAYITETIYCPCMDCIVKMICRTECADFRLFLNTYGSKWFKNKFTVRWRRTHGE